MAFFEVARLRQWLPPHVLRASSGASRREVMVTSLRGAKRRIKPRPLPQRDFLDYFAEPVIARAFARPVGSQ